MSCMPADALRRSVSVTIPSLPLREFRVVLSEIVLVNAVDPHLLTIDPTRYHCIGATYDLPQLRGSPLSTIAVENCCVQSRDMSSLTERTAHARVSAPRPVFGSERGNNFSDRWGRYMRCKSAGEDPGLVTRPSATVPGS
jgi:hypothetical protein